MRLLRAISFLSTAALVWLTTSCGDPLEDFQVHFSPEFYDYTVAVWITDIANPDELIDGASIAIEGRDAARVFNYDGNRDIEVIDGRVTMIIGPGPEPSEDNPIQYTVKISKNGYQDRYEPIAVYPDQTYQNRVVPILSTTNLPQGAHFATTTASLNPDGSLAADLSLDVAPSGNQAMSISLPAGVTFFDENGNQLTGSALEVEVLGIEEGVDANIAMRLGTSTNQLLIRDGIIDTAFIPPSGFLRVKMSVGGIKVKSFGSGSLSFKIGVPNSALNWKSGETVEQGDSVLFLSRTEGSNLWEEIGFGEIEILNGELSVNGTTSHLSDKTYSTGIYAAFTNYFHINSNGHGINSYKIELGNDNQFHTIAHVQNQGGVGNTVFAYRSPRGASRTFQIRFEVETPKETFDWNDIGFISGGQTATNRHYIVLPQAPPPYKATVQLYCENSVDEDGNPTSYLYPPVGTMIWLSESGFFDNIVPTYIVQTEKWNEFVSSEVEAGQTVNITAVTPDGGGYIKLGHTLVQDEVFTEQVETKNCDYLSGGN